MTEQIFLNGEQVDIDPSTNVTLNFKSNLLSDISKITASNSQTISLPKTTRNRRILDNPSAIAYASGRRYKRFNARYLRNGIEVVQAAYAIILSAAERYEIAVYWGVMTNFQAWLDRGGKLTELEGAESLAWSKAVSATDLATMASRGYGYAVYDCGVDNVDLIKFHPSATAWWVLSKIAAQAGFTVDISDKYRDALKALAMPCLGRNGSEITNTEDATIITYPYIAATTGHWGLVVTPTAGSDKHGVLDLKDTTKINRVDGATKLSLSIVSANIYGNPNGKSLSVTVYANNVNEFKDQIYICATLYDGTSEQTKQLAHSTSSTTVSGSTGIFAYKKTYYFDSISETLIWRNYKFARLSPWDGSSNIIGSILSDNRTTLIEDFENIIYPSTFPIIPNLPEITQVDFIKAICAMLGIFAVADPASTDRLKFISMEELQGRKTAAADWSERLVRGSGDEPKTVEFKINDYCRNNLFKYKQDDTGTTSGDGNMKIDSEVLEKEKIVITLPFAASDGESIPHYKLNDDGSEVDTINVKDRIMLVKGNGYGNAKLSFEGLDFTTLLAEYYPTLQQVVNEAITIKEKIRLNEIDLKTLDFTRPVYLRQYGRYYGVVSIQTSGDAPCEVKLVQLPPTRLVRSDVHISHRQDGARVVVTASKSVASDISISYSGRLSGIIPTLVGSAIIRAGGSSVTIQVPADLYSFSMSITPTSDDQYNYIIIS